MLATRRHNARPTLRDFGFVRARALGAWQRGRRRSQSAPPGSPNRPPTRPWSRHPFLGGVRFVRPVKEPARKFTSVPRWPRPTAYLRENPSMCSARAATFVESLPRRASSRLIAPRNRRPCSAIGRHRNHPGHRIRRRVFSAALSARRRRACVPYPARAERRTKQSASPRRLCFTTRRRVTVGGRSGVRWHRLGMAFWRPLRDKQFEKDAWGGKGRSPSKESRHGGVVSAYSHTCAPRAPKAGRHQGSPATQLEL